jgi:hypothetical protein
MSSLHRSNAGFTSVERKRLTETAKKWKRPQLSAGICGTGRRNSTLDTTAQRFGGLFGTENLRPVVAMVEQSGLTFETSTRS